LATPPSHSSTSFGHGSGPVELEPPVELASPVLVSPVVLVVVVVLASVVLTPLVLELDELASLVGPVLCSSVVLEVGAPVVGAVVDAELVSVAAVRLTVPGLESEPVSELASSRLPSSPQPAMRSARTDAAVRTRGS